MKTAWITILVTLAIVLCGCSPSQTDGDDSLVVPPEDPKSPVSTVDPSAKPQNPATAAAPLPLQPVSPVQGAITPMGPSMTSPYPPDLQDLVDIAVKDLAQRLSVPLDEIKVSAVYDVIWPDAGLGCPRSGVAYAQVLTTGYLILLEYNSVKYEYHSDKKDYVVYCENPSAPLALPEQ